MPSSRTPLWQSIRQSLTDDIAAGRYRPGDKLPTEAVLSARFGVNRHTVRRALADMGEDGLIHARRGAGVFVARKPTEYPIGRRVRFHRNLQAAGQVPARRILTLETRQADSAEAESLALGLSARVHVAEGVSLADDQPIALFRSAFPAARFPDLLRTLEDEPSVTAALAAHGVPDHFRAWTRIAARRATATQALRLHLPEGAPLLRSVSVNVDPEGQPVEYGRTWFAGDRVTLSLSDT